MMTDTYFTGPDKLEVRTTTNMEKPYLKLSSTDLCVSCYIYLKDWQQLEQLIEDGKKVLEDFYVSELQVHLQDKEVGR